MDKFMGTINTNGLAIWYYTKDLYVTTYRYIFAREPTSSPGPWGRDGARASA